uniref:Uncharacterized protein n=1 Tax=Castor canadensis TaxID=51338 RepID=A0A8C0WH92_CASCN
MPQYQTWEEHREVTNDFVCLVCRAHQGQGIAEIEKFLSKLMPLMVGIPPKQSRAQWSDGSCT